MCIRDSFWAGNDNPAYSYWSTTNPNEAVFVGGGNVRASIDLDNGASYFGNQVRSPIFYDSDDTTYYANPAGQSLIKQVRAADGTSGYSIMTGAQNTSRVYNDTARKSLVVNSDYYPHIYVNALTANTNENHGAVISMTGNISGGGFRRWSFGIPVSYTHLTLPTILRV